MAAGARPEQEVAKANLADTAQAATRWTMKSHLLPSCAHDQGEKQSRTAQGEAHHHPSRR